MAKRKHPKSSEPARVIGADDKLPPVAEYLRAEIEEQLTSREALRKTLLNTLRVAAHDLNEIVTYGTVREAQAFAKLAEDGPAYADILRHVAQLIDFASERINEAVMLRSDAIELFEHCKTQLRKGLS